jgi:A1 cistron-splicing factor AAR2
MSAKRASDELGEIHVKRWNRYDEVLSEEVSAAEIRIQKACVPEILDKLQRYTGTSISKSTLRKAPGTTPSGSEVINIWPRLTSAMKGALLTKITGNSWNYWQVSSTDDFENTGKSMGGESSLEFGLGKTLKFVFPRSNRIFSTNSMGRERTLQAMDASSHIKAVVSDHCTFGDWDEVIGELQFCYVTGMTLGNVACMEQWAHIVKVLFQAFQLILDEPVFFRKAISAIHVQLIYDEEGFDGSILDHDSNLGEDLKKLLTVFKSRLTELLLGQGNDITDQQVAVGKAFESLESWLWKWGWDLRGNYVRSGKMQLEDGEIIDAELEDFEAEDERGSDSRLL